MSGWDEILDGSKIAHHQERVDAWLRGERIAPITIDMALTRTCNYACHFCYAAMQENEREPITQEVMDDFLTDAAAAGVKGISLISDGESTIAPPFKFSLRKGHALGIDMAVGTNGLLFSREWSEELLETLVYLRVNFSAGEKERYAQIMGAKEGWFDRVCKNIRDMMDVKAKRGLKTTVGMQMVLDPRYADQIMPLAHLARDLAPDYLVIKHCSDDVDGKLGVEYEKYAELEDMLRQAEALSTEKTKIVVKWHKIRDGNTRSYQRCYGPPFMLQISGSGLVAPCGVMFNERYRKFHIGNIVKERFRDILASDRYWEVMKYLNGGQFDASRECGALCLQHMTNTALNDLVQHGKPLKELSGDVQHANFI